jgi:hypothetical protein
MEVALLPQKDLRALFSTNLVDLDAVHVFANRDDERVAFDDAFAAHRRLVRDGAPDIHDLVSPRRNVLTYFGVGGVGKTTLSKQLQARLDSPDAEGPADWPGTAADAGRALTVRLDLSREASLDVESIVLLLRAALAPLGRPMVAFDLALGRYWERTHRERLDDYLSRHGFLQRIPQASRLPDFVRQALDEAAELAGLASPGLPLLVQTGPALVSYLRDRSRRRQALKGCLRLPDLLEADSTIESLSYFPHLLAWDLAQRQRKDDLSMVVFLDTFEEIGTRTNRELERLVQRMVWLMPNAFFVVTGRNRLDWDDLRLVDRLDWVGPVSWPGLAGGAEVEPRQHLVGFLSDEDSDHYLRGRLIRHGEPAIPASVRGRIVTASHGLPLFLDLSVMRFLSILAQGRAPSLHDFDHAFPGVVARVFRDLDEGERMALRAASLLDSFDVELAVVAAGLRTETPVLQLIQRAFVQYDGTAVLPYHIHDLVRKHVREADVGLADSWSGRDWQNAAIRIVAHLGHMAVSSGERRDRRTLVAALNQSFQLVHEFDLPIGWLIDGAYRFVEDSVWEPTLRPRIPDPELADGPPVTAAHALGAGLIAINQRQRVHRSQTLGILDTCLRSGLVEGDAADLLAYFRAECQRDLGMPAESERGMRSLVESGGKMADIALRGLSHVQRRRGRFRELTEQLSGRPTAGVWHRVWGDLWWTQGRLDEAAGEYDRAISWARSDRRTGEEATSAACLAWAAALRSQSEGIAGVQRARQALGSVTITWADLQVGCAEALLACGDREAVERLCDELQRKANAHGLTSSAAYAGFARAFHYATVQDLEGLAEARRKIRALVKDEEFAYLCEIVDFWLRGVTPASDLSLADWVDGRIEAASRWQQIVDHRRREREEVR